MLEDTYVPRPILPYNIWENLQTSEAYISETFVNDLDIKVGRVVKNAIFYDISNVWTCSSKSA